MNSFASKRISSFSLLRRRLLQLALMLVVGGCASSLARAEQSGDGPAREKLRQLLSAYEFIPTREVLLGIHPQVDRLLRDMVQRPRLPSGVLARTRAIALLRHFPGPATTAVLREVIEAGRKARDPHKDGLALLDLGQALASYAQVAGPQALELLRPFLVSHTNVDVRIAAARAVRLSRNPAALALLRSRQEADPSATVKARLAREIELLLRPDSE